MNIKKNITFTDILFAAFLIIVIVYLDCRIFKRIHKSADSSGRIMKTNTVILHDTVSDTIRYPVPVPVWHDTGRTRWRNVPVDTAAIVADYQSRVAYRRVLKDDSSALAIIYDTVTGNRLTEYRFEFRNRRPTTIIHNTLIRDIESAWLLSGTISIAIMPEKTKLFGGFTLTDPRQRSYTVMTDPVLKSWQAGVSMPIWRWHRKVPEED